MPESRCHGGLDELTGHILVLWGGVKKLLFPLMLNWVAKFMAIDKQTYNNVVHDCWFRKTDCFLR